LQRLEGPLRWPPQIRGAAAAAADEAAANEKGAERRQSEEKSPHLLPPSVAQMACYPDLEKTLVNQWYKVG
jgi:hypothetical protein